ncbi:MAG TPA: DUF4386 domain-containing protein [Candidatus Limnocylindria bacterium]|nr:DUF4386 domain-containing protein [Candidatus Limnocylindria bacterium]
MLYLLSAVPAAFSIVYVPAAFVVAEDAAATARRITDAELVYRIGILSDLVSQIVWIFLAVSLYNLLKAVDKGRAILMLTCALIIVPIGFVDLIVQVAPLIVLSGADFLSAFTKPQLDALAFTLVALRINGLIVASAFWGLWLFPFGMLVIRSGFFPKVLGILLIVAGAAYLTASFASIVVPAQRQVVALVALPFYAVGELAMIGWLLVKGATTDRARVVSAVTP